jgi:LPS-assembly protein
MIRRMNRRQALFALGCVVGVLTASVTSHAADDLGDSGDSQAGSLASAFWKPRAELSVGVASGLASYCEGAYQLPVMRYPLSINSADYPIEAQATSAEYLQAGDVTMRGDVRIQQGNRHLRAPIVRLNHKTREAAAEGGVVLEQPDILLAGERARINLDSKELVLQEVEFLLIEPEFRGEAAEVERDGDGTLTIRRGSFTRCEPGSSNWWIQSKSFVIEENAVFGTARHAVLRVKNVPVFYTPYLSFPVTQERKSGFLFPGLGYSSEEGLDITLPYYFNLAKNYDATLIPRYLEERGMGLEGEFRHLSQRQETTLSGAYLGDDDLFNGEFDKDDFEELLDAGSVSGDFDPADRWLYAVDHRGRFGGVATRVDYTAVSDRDYFRDLGTDLGVSSRIELERRGELRTSYRGVAMRLWAQRFQRLDDVDKVEPYQRLPELTLAYAGAALGPLEWSVDARFVSFDRANDELTGSARVVGERLHVEPRVRLPFSRPWGFVTLAGGFRYTRYDLRDTAATVDAKPQRDIGFGSVDAGLYFERDLEWFATPLVQTLEPRMFYLYQEFEDQSQLPRFDTSALTFSYAQLYRNNRFSGLDRIGDADQLSVGVTTRFINRESGREYFRASVGEIVYFDDRAVTLSGAISEDNRHGRSALATQLATTIGHWRVTGSVIWDGEDNQVDEGGGQIQYRSDNNHIFNIGYRNRLREDIEQTDISLKWPISRRLSVLGRWNYDLVSGRTIEGMGGIEYNDCCWQIRLLARRFIDSPSARQIESIEADQGVFLQVVFKGLAGIGSKIESVLERGIRGYTAAGR